MIHHSISLAKYMAPFIGVQSHHEIRRETDCNRAERFTDREGVGSTNKHQRGHLLVTCDVVSSHIK